MQEMLHGGQIEPSDSPWASPVVLVTQKDGSTRFCVDYRRLNALTTKDDNPLPRIDDSLRLLGNQQWFSTMDLVVRGPDMEKVNPFGDFVRPIFLNTCGCLKHESKCWMTITSHRK